MPEITIKDPERKGKMKWKMIDRETKDTGVWTRQDIALSWQQAKQPKEPRLGGLPTIYRKQHPGQLGWAFLMKRPRAVDLNLQTDDH
jgi:hypothetical protein